jgi:Fe-S-cluster containining protein
MPSKQEEAQQLEWRRYVHGIYQGTKTLTANAFNRSKSLDNNDKLIRKIQIIENSSLASVLSPIAALPAEQRKAYEPQCSEGCCYCCYQWVRLTVPEVLAIGKYLHENASADQIEYLKKESEKYRDEFLQMPTDKLFSLKCPLLINNLCSVYESRPIICRGVTSLSVEACKTAMENPSSPDSAIPTITPLLDIAMVMRTAVRDGILEANMDGGDLVLGIALKIILDDPLAGEKYFAGEDVFADARAPDITEDRAYRIS